MTARPGSFAPRFGLASGRSAPCAQPETHGRNINGRTSDPPATSSPEVCSFQLPKVCSFQLPLTAGREQVTRIAAQRANRDPFTVCQTRHSFAIWLRHVGADLADIQELYGHTDATTMSTYTAPTLAKQRDATRRLRVVTAGKKRGLSAGGGGCRERTTIE